MSEEAIREDESLCPPWCVGDHDQHAGAALVHRGPLRSAEVRARRVRRNGGFTPQDEQDLFEAQLVRYGDDPSVWVSLRTRSGDPIEVAIADANRWVVLLGSTMVDEGARER